MWSAPYRLTIADDALGTLGIPAVESEHGTYAAAVAHLTATLQDAGLGDTATHLADDTWEIRDADGDVVGSATLEGPAWWNGKRGPLTLGVHGVVDWKFIRRTVLEDVSSAAITAFLYGVNAWALRADADVTYNPDGGMKVITADSNVYVYTITEGRTK